MDSSQVTFADPPSAGELASQCVMSPTPVRRLLLVLRHPIAASLWRAAMDAVERQNEGEHCPPSKNFTVASEAAGRRKTTHGAVTPVASTRHAFRCTAWRCITATCRCTRAIRRPGSGTRPNSSREHQRISTTFAAESCFAKVDFPQRAHFIVSPSARKWRIDPWWVLIFSTR